MTPAEVNRAVLSLKGDHLQNFLLAVRSDAAGSAGPLPLSLAPGYASHRKLKWPIIDWVSGRWFDQQQSDAKGETLTDLVLWVSAVDEHIEREIDEELATERERRLAKRLAEARQQAADAIARWIEALPPPMQPSFTAHEVERPEPTVRPIPHRSFRRG